MRANHEPRPTQRPLLVDQLPQLIDKKRIDLSKRLGTIPSRSDVVRLALEAYLGVDLSETEADGRRKSRE